MSDSTNTNPPDAGSGGSQSSPPNPATAPAPLPPSQAAGAGSGPGTGDKPRGRGRPPGSKTRPKISDKKLREERHDDKRRENLLPARAALAEKREETTAAAEKPALSEETLKHGTRMFVRLLWRFAGLGARIFGGRLQPLADGDLNEGAAEAVPLVKRVPLLAKLLSVLGFPLWLADAIDKKFERKPAPAPALRAVPDEKAAP